MRKLKVYATKLLRIMTHFDEKRYLRAENPVSSNLGYSYKRRPLLYKNLLTDN